jgi:hypothetical protein
MKKLLLIPILLSLTGCGNVDWFPPPTETSQVQLEVQSQDAGRYLYSYRSMDDRTAVTTRGVFRVYTSLHPAPQTQTYLDTYTDKTTREVTGKFLRAGGETAMVLQVMRME